LENKNKELEHNEMKYQNSQHNEARSKNDVNNTLRKKTNKEKDMNKKCKMYKKFNIECYESSSEKSSFEYESDTEDNEINAKKGDNAHRKNKPKNNDDKRKAKHKTSVPYNNRLQDQDDFSPYLIDSDNDQGNSSVVKYIEKTIATNISHTKKKNDEANNLKSQVRLTKPTKKKSKVDISDEYTNSLPQRSTRNLKNNK
ncbi:10893_t:CDS:2, partial [Funneliformis caledonium]